MIQNKAEAYKWAAKRVRAQTSRQVDRIATLANTAAILKEYLPNFFWVGFYFVLPEQMILGPFQGPPACVGLPYDRGVCAAAVSARRTIRVDHVDEFPGHIACDSRSKAEIVVPVFDAAGMCRAVLDVDSETPAGFDCIDEKGLEHIADLLKEIWNTR